MLGESRGMPYPPLDEVLREQFGLASFRPWQREAIEAVLGEPGRVLVVAPTGGGKSLTYQLPATVLHGTTLVLCPLVALMEDQVRALQARNIEATFLASTLAIEERQYRESSRGRARRSRRSSSSSSRPSDRRSSRAGARSSTRQRAARASSGARRCKAKATAPAATTPAWSPIGARASPTRSPHARSTWSS